MLEQNGVIICQETALLKKGSCILVEATELPVSNDENKC